MADPKRRLSLLRRTLQSISQQDDPAFNIVVVGSDAALPPGSDLPDCVQLLPIGFPPASAKPRPTWDELWNDKGAKIALGIAHARRQGSTHVMAVDSDDFVSQRLARQVKANSASAGWYSPRGYLHVVGTRKLLAVDEDFHMRCGSSHIVSATDHPVSPDLGPTLSRSEVVDHVGEETIRKLLGAHRSVIDFLANRGVHLEPLPFPAAVWEIGSGENYTQILNIDADSVVLDAQLSKEFGMPIPSPFQHGLATLGNSARRLKRKLGG